MNLLIQKHNCFKFKSMQLLPKILELKRFITSNEVAAALRPFYFSVHPDLFGQHPKEREINEDSLKILQEYLESLQKNEAVRVNRITFYLRSTPLTTTSAGSFRRISLTLAQRNLRDVVKDILEASRLSTDYLKNIPDESKKQKLVPDRPIFWSHSIFTDPEVEAAAAAAKFVPESLSLWLGKNYPHMVVKLEINRPIREQNQKFRKELIERLQLNNIVYKCGWGSIHFRGCLQSFNQLSLQYPQHLAILAGRTVVFERMTGIDLDGHVILSVDDVRQNWLAFIKTLHQPDTTLSRIPAIQQAVSRVLRDIQVVHRKFQPAVSVGAYENQLRKLCTALSDHWVKHGYPMSWPRSLDQFQLVVQCEAGPLMLSPTGQFIAPASCPAFMLVNFITEHMVEATNKLKQYESQKYIERELHQKCQLELELADLSKDDNVTPDMMITFCKRLLQQKKAINNFMKGSFVYVTHYYCVLQGGELCIPWNWHE